MRKKLPEPKIFTEYGKVITCACNAFKFRPLAFTIRKIGGLERKCLSLQCAACTAITTVTKPNDNKPLEQLITLDKDNVQNENIEVQAKSKGRRQNDSGKHPRIYSKRSKKEVVPAS